MEFQALPFTEPATGLIYARARWYDPSTGSFLSPDPKGYIDSSNLYAFAGGDPVNRRDPTGEFFDAAAARVAAFAKTPAGGAGAMAAAWLTLWVQAGIKGHETVEAYIAVKDSEAEEYAAEARLIDTQAHVAAHKRKKAGQQSSQQAGQPQLPVAPGVSPYKQQRQATTDAAVQQQLDAYHNAASEATPAPVPSASGDGPCQPNQPIDSSFYSVFFRANIGEDLYPNRSDKAHFQDANRQLYELMQKNPEFAKELEKQHPGITKFLEPGARGAYPRQTPSDYGLTWHHEPTAPGVLELIPVGQHRAPGPMQRSLHPGGCGGMETWGGGRKPRKK